MWESQCVKITQSQPYAIIGNIYRPPFEGSDDFDLFLREFNDFVNIMSSYGHSSYICGDFNINLLKINTKPHYDNFLEKKGCPPVSFQKLLCQHEFVTPVAHL